MNPQDISPAQDPLAQLKDIHLPEAIGVWPLAWGWWLLLVIVITILGITVFFIRRHTFRNAYRALALNELQRINRQYSHDQGSAYLQDVSILLRRTALSGFGTQFNTSVKGEDWLLWLDAQSRNNKEEFSAGPGRALLIGPYQKAPEFDRVVLHKIIEQWIQHHQNQWQKKKTVVSNKNETAHHV